MRVLGDIHVLTKMDVSKDMHMFLQGSEVQEILSKFRKRSVAEVWVDDPGWWFGGVEMASFGHVFCCF